ncbi:phage capsid protein [Hyphomonas sp.]|jgi:hypothetical protein|uniref:phage capsid protein n=1 Tax=Hyphomonas sp. TaxID=87 RepID=UPI0032EEE67F
MALEPSSLEGHKVIIFARNVDLVGQQETSRLVNHVSADLAFMESGDRYTDELMGTSDPSPVLNDIRPTPGGTITKSRRFAFFQTFDDGKWVGTREKAEQLVDPTNPTVRAMGFGRERRRDRTIMNAFFDPSYENDADGKISVTALPSTNVVAVDDWTYFKGKADAGATAPTADAGLTVPKLRKAKVLASKAQLKGEWCIAYEEEDLQNLLTSVEVGSSDYNKVNALIDGERTRYMGFNFVQVESGACPVSASVGKLPFWNKENILYKERPLVTTRVQERPDMSYRWHAFYEAQDSWLRSEDKGVGSILCKRD